MGSASSVSPREGDDVPDCPVIDAHVHIMPTKILDAVSDWFESEAGWAIPKLSAEAVAERASQRTDGFVFFPYAHQPDISASLNEFAADWQLRLDSAIGLGTVHAGDSDPERIVPDLFERGLQGVKLHCPVQGFSADDARLDPVYEALVARDAPLVIHASTHPFYRGDSTLGAAPLGRVLRRFPALRVCVPHLGLFESDSFFDLADRYTIYFDTSVALGEETWERIGRRPDDISMNRLANYGDKVMFGTDYPIRPQPYRAAFRGIHEVFGEQTSAVYHRNARRFFGFQDDGQ